MRRQKGFILLYVLFFAAAAIILAAASGRLIVLNIRMVRSQLDGARAFYAAESGIEWAKAKLASDPGWYTDLPHSPVDDIGWLTGSSVGYNGRVGGSPFKVVREEGKGRLYSVGRSGSGMFIVRMDFSSLPFTQKSWEVL